MEIIEEGFGKIIQALQFAADKHKDQRRKDGEASPYINHPIQVMKILWDEGDVREQQLLIAAILHDTLEDTQTTAEELRDWFGDAVCLLVLEVTDDKSLSKSQRKQLQVTNAGKKSILAKQLKIADKVANIRDIMNSPPEGWSVERKLDYIGWAENVFAGLVGINEKLDICFKACVSEARKMLSEGQTTL